MDLYLVCLVFCQNKTVLLPQPFVVVHLVKEIQQKVVLKMVELLLKIRKFNLCRAVLWSDAESIAGEVLLSLSCRSIGRCVNCRRDWSNFLSER